MANKGVVDTFWAFCYFYFFINFLTLIYPVFDVLRELSNYLCFFAFVKSGKPAFVLVISLS